MISSPSRSTQRNTQLSGRRECVRAGCGQNIPVLHAPFNAYSSGRLAKDQHHVGMSLTANTGLARRREIDWV